MKSGKLKIFFGYADGNGKTYTMLQAALRQKALGFDVIVVPLAPQTREETYMLAQDLEFLPMEDSDHVNLVIERNPAIVVFDDLSSNQSEIEALIQKGFDVYTTLNVFDIHAVRQQLQLSESFFKNTAVDIDRFRHIIQMEFIDIEPDELLMRYKAEEIYPNSQTHQDRAHLFEEKTLKKLRETALEINSRYKSIFQGNTDYNIGDIRVLPSNEYLLVCISSALSSRRVIQVAARAANTVKAHLIALHVETRRTGRRVQPEEQQLRSNLKLAEQLGAEVVVVEGRSIAQTIAEYAAMRNIRRIAIGREQARAFPRILFTRDIVQSLLKLIPWAEIQIIPGFPSDYHISDYRISRLSKDSHSSGMEKSAIPVFTMFKQLLIFSGAALLAILFDTLGLSEANIIMVFLLGVVLVSLSGGRWIGIATSVVSVMLFNFLFTEPRYTFVVNDPQYLVLFPVLFIVALITSELVNRAKREAQAADIREQRTQALYRISHSLLSATGTRSVIKAALEHLSGILNVGMVVYLPENNSHVLVSYHLGPDSQQAEQFETIQEKNAAEWCFENARPAGYGTPHFSSSKGLYVPIQTQSRVLGVLGVDSSKTISDESRNSMIEAVAAQIALALDRENLAREQEKSRIEIEHERLRSNLLRSISHDLRSPLASIAGSSSTLLYDWKNLNNKSRSDLLENIQQDVTWLTQLFENLLSLAKVEGSMFVMNTERELVDDIVVGSLNKLSSRCAEHTVKIDLPDEPIFVPVDVGLVQQVLINLIDNALRYTPKGSTITVTVRTRGKRWIEFSVADNGQGIPVEFHSKIFDRFFTLKNNEDQRRGLGLGLSICKSIAEIHQGTMKLKKSISGGAEFVFTLPLVPPDEADSGK